MGEYLGYMVTGGFFSNESANSIQKKSMANVFCNDYCLIGVMT